MPAPICGKNGVFPPLPNPWAEGPYEMSKHSTDAHNKTALISTLAGMTDEELLLEYRSTGDERVFSQLVRRYEKELYSYLRRFLGDATLAEDAFQATFLQVHLKCDQFEEGRKLRPWLYTVATNQAIDAQRRNRRHRLVSLNQTHRSGDDDLGTLMQLLVNQEQLPTEQLEEEERRNWVQQAVSRLPEQLRSTVILVYFQGLKYREAAEVLSIPVGTVKSRLHSAVLKLNEAWNQDRHAGAD
jgi:RNA polymerase sigma-70 factor (ECF subfamily)